MPVRAPTNNKILPPNARASDVASKAIQEILPAQQTKNLSAMRVQGYEGLLYTHLTQGRKCTCQSSQKHLNTRLGEDGKARPSDINNLLTGSNMFDVTPYGSSPNRSGDNVTSPSAPANKHQGVFDVVGYDENQFDTVHVIDGKGFGDNGPINTDFDIETLVGDWDASAVGITDAHCGVCFGRGFVGGYAPFHASRIIKTVDDVDLGASEIDVTKKPWTATGSTFATTVVLPFGAIGVDIFRVMNNHRPVAANFTIDGIAATVLTVVSKCDGKPHTVGVQLLDTGAARTTPFEWTHLEMQFITSDQSAYFEFPRLNKGSDTALLEQLDPFSIIIGSNVPSLQSQDIITESTFGKTLIVENSNWWNTRNRDILGWECQVRVLQPQEIYNILPRRGRILTKAPTPVGQHDNSTGRYRT